MTLISKYLSVVLASMLKFVGGPLAGLALHLSLLETILCTIVGMMVSVFLFTFLGQWLRLVWEDLRKTKRKRFSKSTRRAVRIYRKFGIAGIACLTPLLFTPIGGTLLAVSFKASPLRILSWMLVFAVLWAVVFSWAFYNLSSLQDWFIKK